MDVLVELTGPKMFHTFFGISTIHGGQMCLQRYPYLTASSASMLLVRSTKLRFTQRVTDNGMHFCPRQVVDEIEAMVLKHQ